MSKLTKLLSVFVIASTVTAGVAALAGCHTHTYDEKWSTSETQHWHAATCAHEDQKKDLGDHVDANDDGKCDVCGYQMEVEEEHTHTYSNEWTSDETQHWHAATCEHTDQKKDAANHVDANEDGKCDVCGYQMQTAPEVEGIPAPEGTSGLIIEKTTTTYTLSAASPTVDISTADLKVYYADAASEKLGEVDLSKATITYFKGSETLENLNGVSSAGTYMIYVKLEGVLPEGATETVDLSAFISITVNDPVVADTLAINADAVKTQTQSTTDSMTSTWEFTVTLASGAKVDVTEDVTISGVETTAIGEKTATVSLTYEDINFSIDVEYSITDDANLAIQSCAVNPGVLEANSNITANVTLDETNGIVLTATSGKLVKIDSADEEIDGKVFTKRLNMQGSPIKNGGLDPAYTTPFRTIQFTNLNSAIEGATSIKTVITMYVNTSSSGAVRTLNLYKEGEVEGVKTLTAVEGQTAEVGGVCKITFTVEGAGTYHVASASSGWYVYYIQVDKMIIGETGEVDKPLAGEATLAALSLNTADVKKTFKVGDTFTAENLVATGVYANSVTADSSTRVIAFDDLEISSPDMSNLGEQTVTVTYGGVSETYKITIESAVAGVTGISASHNLDSLMVDTDADTIPFVKDNISVEIVGENGLAQVNITSIKVDGVDLPAEGTALTPGAHTIIVAVTVTDGTNSAEFTASIELTVTVKPADSSTASFIVEGTESGSIDAEATIVENGLFTATTDQKLNYSIGKNEAEGVARPDKAVTVELQDGTEKTFTMGLVQGSDTDPGATTEDIIITAKEAVTLRVYVAFTNNSFNSDRAATINYTVGTGAAQTISYSKRENVATITVTLQANESLTVNATNNATGKGRLWLFGIEAAVVEE